MKRSTTLWAGFAALSAVLCATGCDAIASSLEDVIARIKPSIVAVGTFEPTRSPQFSFRGTGFVVGDGTLIATNAHVLPDKLDGSKLEVISVTLPSLGERPSQRRNVRLAVLDEDHDLALLRLDEPALPALSISKRALAREGEAAAFTGFPIGAVLGLVPATHRATVSAITPIALPMERARELDQRLIRRLEQPPISVLQLDATSYPGNSGSPLYDVDTGEVIGIMNMVFVKTTREAVLSQPSGISFAIPASYLLDLIQRAN